ncbi:MAG TPA: hypothetical protein VGY77_12395, partial [Gemmataceae bacterium]|nr:hypothetical protein [Gemmataceae bacterium]
GAALPPEQPDRRQFVRNELLEMQQSRKTVFGKAGRWAAIALIPSALLGLGLGSFLSLVWNPISADWTAPPILVSLVLGAIAGALGAATAGALFHSFFELDQDVPVIVIGLATLIVIGAGIYGAGHGGMLYSILFMAIGLPAGIAGGLLVYISVWGLKWIFDWALKEVKGF